MRRFPSDIHFSHPIKKKKKWEENLLKSRRVALALKTTFWKAYSYVAFSKIKEWNRTTRKKHVYLVFLFPPDNFLVVSLIYSHTNFLKKVFFLVLVQSSSQQNVPESRSHHRRRSTAPSAVVAPHPTTPRNSWFLEGPRCISRGDLWCISSWRIDCRSPSRHGFGRGTLPARAEHARCRHEVWVHRIFQFRAASTAGIGQEATPPQQ